jgi:hypothetical protein
MISLIKTENFKRPPFIKSIKFCEYKNATIGVCWLSNEKIKVICFDRYDDDGNPVFVECRRDLISDKEDFLLGKRKSPLEGASVQ